MADAEITGTQAAAGRGRSFAAFVAPARARAALWRLLAGLALAVAVYAALNAAAGFAAFLALGPDGVQSLAGRIAVASTPGATLALLATFPPLIVGIALAARLLHGRRPLTLFGPWRRGLCDTARAFAVTLAVYAPFFVLWSFEHDSAANLPAGLWLALLPLTVAAVALQTLAEELAFRGYLQQQLAARFARPLIWAGLPAVLFGALHLDPGRMGTAAPFVAVAAGLFGLMAADLTARTGNLGTAWGLHLANNLIAIAVLATPGTITGLALRVTPYGVADMTLTPMTAATEALPLVAAWLALRWLTRR